MPIVLITEALLLKNTAADGRLLRDRMLSGFCVRMNARKRTFRVATSVAGQQFRMNLGYWPLMSVEEARARAMEVLAQCRRGERPSGPPAPVELPTLRETYMDYCRVKQIKASSQKRYESFFRTHFGDWLDRPVSDMGLQAFSEHCHAFAQPPLLGRACEDSSPFRDQLLPPNTDGNPGALQGSFRILHLMSKAEPPNQPPTWFSSKAGSEVLSLRCILASHRLPGAGELGELASHFMRSCARH